MNSERFAEFLGVFVDVAREGNFSRVARKRGMTPSSVARQVDVLEAYLDNKLFLRSTRTLSLTDAGQVLLRRAQRILDELADVQQEIASMRGEIRGVLRVACLPTFGKKYLIPVIATLAQKHPDLRVDLDLRERLGDPITERVDAVIRIDELADSTLIAIPIATQTRVLCASRGYLERSSEPRTPAELLSHRLLDKIHGADLLGWAEVLGYPIENGDARAVFRSDDFDALRLAALAGLGIANLSDWVVGPDIHSGSLVHVLPELVSRPERNTTIYLLRAPAQPSAKLRVFIEALRGQIGSPPVWAVSSAIP
jgi:DNA-binding transcriptional LysR family regulator